MPTRNRIYFPGNPWPQGHALIDFAWSAELVPKAPWHSIILRGRSSGPQKAPGVWFHLHLESANYYADDGDAKADDDEESTSEWESKVVWHNYHSCTLSSTFWGAPGIHAGTKDAPLDFEQLTSREFRADSTPPGFSGEFPWLPEGQPPAFGLYLLGHDTCADHLVKFTHRLDADLFAIQWSGRIALTYAGDYEFRYRFEVPEVRAQFGGIFLPKETRSEDAKRLIQPYVANVESLRLTEEDGRLVFKLT